MRSELFRPVIVGVDGSELASLAVELAAEEAAARVTPLVLVHVDSDPGGAEALANAAGKVRSLHPAVAVMARTVSGDVAQALADSAADGCLLVVGHRGRKGGSAGSVAQQLIAAASVPVIVYRPLDTSIEPALPRPVLAGIDLDVVSADAIDAVLEFALGAASMRGAPLHVLCLWPGFASPDAPVPGGAPSDAQTAGTIAEVIERWSEKYPGVRTQLTIRHGLDAAIALAAASHTAQLVVVGAGRGAVAQALVHRAGCPVAVVPAVLANERQSLVAD